MAEIVEVDDEREGVDVIYGRSPLFLAGLFSMCLPISGVS